MNDQTQAGPGWLESPYLDGEMQDPESFSEELSSSRQPDSPFLTNELFTEDEIEHEDYETALADEVEEEHEFNKEWNHEFMESSCCDDEFGLEEELFYEDFASEDAEVDPYSPVYEVWDDESEVLTGADDEIEEDELETNDDYGEEGFAEDDFEDEIIPDTIESDGEEAIEYEELYDDELEIEAVLDYEIAAQKDPLPIPLNRPIPFASLPPTGSYWPLQSSHPRSQEVPYLYQAKPARYVGNKSRSFLARRANGTRYHVGIDLYANEKDPVIACEDGVIVNFYHFYRSTYALIVAHAGHVINYGEVHKDSLKASGLKIGDRVHAGQVIGLVGKMYKSSMLHVEMYRSGTTHNHRWLKKNRAPDALLNPTRYLLFLQKYGKTTNGEPTNGTTVPEQNPLGSIFQQGKDALGSMFEKGKLAGVALAAISKGETDERKITNAVFYAKHPDRQGQKLRRNDPLAKDWLHLRNTLVRPLLRQKNGTDDNASNPPSSPPPATSGGTVKMKRGGWGGWKGKSSVSHLVIPASMVQDAYDVAVAVASRVEGSFDKVNMYDRGILSWGIKQWTVHAGSLQTLLSFIHQQLQQRGQSDRWNQLFPGVNLRDKTLVYRGRGYPTGDKKALMQLFRGSTNPADYQENTLNHWIRLFARAGRDPVIQQLQFDHAKAELTGLMRRNLGATLTRLRRRKSKASWNRTIRGFRNFDADDYGRIGDYLGKNAKAIALFNGMFTQNPAWTYIYLKRVIDTMIAHYGTSRTSGWPSHWRDALEQELEQSFARSGVACWGSEAINNKKACRGRTSRTDKLLKALAAYQR